MRLRHLLHGEHSDFSHRITAGDGFPSLAVTLPQWYRIGRTTTQPQCRTYAQPFSSGTPLFGFCSYLSSKRPQQSIVRKHASENSFLRSFCCRQTTASSVFVCRKDFRHTKTLVLRGRGISTGRACVGAALTFVVFLSCSLSGRMVYFAGTTGTACEFSRTVPLASRSLIAVTVMSPACRVVSTTATSLPLNRRM